MALVKNLRRISMKKNTVHGEVDCTYTVFEKNRKKFLQVDTYGSPTREFVGKKSQSLQFDENSMRELHDMIARML